jgi:nucleoside 2-deoxyribosyltransferase
MISDVSAMAQKKTLFVIQPFGKSSEDIYQLVSAAAAQASVAAIRADSVVAHATTHITETIHRAILDASLVAADVTDANPNVMYEVGYAQAQNKPLILIASSSRSIPFDLASVRVVIYDATNPGEFVQRLSKAIAQALKTPEDFLFSKLVAESAKRPNVFISYSHSDAEYLDRLLVHLKPLEKEGLIDLWVDTRLRAGDRWRKEIEKALQRSTVAILLVSADFLASDFITDNELPPLLRNAEERGTRVIPLIVKPCQFTRDKSLRHFQSINDPKRALVLLPGGQQELIFDQVATEVEKWLQMS